MAAFDRESAQARARLLQSSQADADGWVTVVGTGGRGAACASRTDAARRRGRASGPGGAAKRPQEEAEAATAASRDLLPLPAPRGAKRAFASPVQRNRPSHTPQKLPSCGANLTRTGSKWARCGRSASSSRTSSGVACKCVQAWAGATLLAVAAQHGLHGGLTCILADTRNACNASRASPPLPPYAWLPCPAPRQSPAHIIPAAWAGCPLSGERRRRGG